MKEMAKAEAQKRGKFMQQVQCPSCGRRFHSRVAEDHIKACVERAKLEENKKKWGKQVAKVAGEIKKTLPAKDKNGPFESPIRERFTRTPSAKQFDSSNIKAKINTGLRVSQEVRSPAIETPSSRLSPSVKSNVKSKFCTSCGGRFASDAHRFCGDCGTDAPSCGCCGGGLCRSGC